MFNFIYLKTHYHVCFYNWGVFENTLPFEDLNYLLLHFVQSHEYKRIWIWGASVNMAQFKFAFIAILHLNLCVQVLLVSTWKFFAKAPFPSSISFASLLSSIVTIWKCCHFTPLKHRTIVSPCTCTRITHFHRLPGYWSRCPHPCGI